MTTAEQCHEVTAVELNAEEARTLFDSLTRERMGMSGADFLDAYDAGKFDDVEPDQVSGLTDVVMALPFAR